MKLFLATNSETAKTNNIKMLEKSVISALKNTNFEVYVIFDGKKEELNLPKEANVIEHRHRLYNTFLNSSRNKTKGFIRTASSAFLRTEIPYLCKKLDFKDKYVMYTDYDVIFEKSDYSDLNTFTPKYFAACPETNKENWSMINSGVMLMNIYNLLNEDNIIIDHINKNLDNYKGYDQSMFNSLYKNKWSKLPLEYNWKPYWGINNNAKIIHFHGAKPKIVEPKSRYNEPIVKYLREKDLKSYEHYNKIWESY